LLADVWARHRDTALHEASFLDAAVLYATFSMAGQVIHDEAKVARLWLKAGPRQGYCRLGGRTSQRLRGAGAASLFIGSHHCVNRR
jgi:hypothetical protein